MDIINEEELQFLKTLSRGKRLFVRTVSKLESKVIPGVLNTYVRAAHEMYMYG